MRLVRGASGAVEIDASGKKPGRGAYLCPSKDCWQLALKKNSLEFALRTKLSKENRQSLAEQASKLLERN